MPGRIARVVIALAALVPLLVGGALVRQVVLTSAERIRTPDPTDFQGEIVFDHALRVREGLPIYAQPDATFCPLLYTPLYYWACAAVMTVAGPEPATCRVTTVLLLGIAVALLIVLVGKVTRSVLACAAVPVAVASGYAACGFFMDAPRVDAASWPLIAGAVLAATFAARPRSGLLVGMLLGAAFFAKQTTAAFAVPFLAVLLLRGWRVAAAAAGAYVLVVAGGVAAATALTGGWFWKVCVLLPADHPVPFDRLATVFRSDWTGKLRGFSVLTLAVALPLALRWRGTPADRALRFLLLSFLPMLLMSTLSHAREGGTVKTLIPACLLLSAIVPVGLWRFARMPEGRAGVAAAVVAVLAFTVLPLEGRFAREDALITPEVTKSWEKLAKALEPRAREGEVWTAMSGYPRYPGRPMRPGELALNDWLYTERNPVPPALEQAIRSQAFSAIVLQSRMSRTGRDDRATRLTQLVQESYRVARTVNVQAGIGRRRLAAAIWVPIRNPGGR